jgi:hypothetical protein
LAYERSPRSRGLEPFEVAGGPAWMRPDRFDLNATAGREVPVTELRRPNGARAAEASST